MSDDLMREDYELKKLAYWETRKQLAMYGISADPSITIRAQNLAAELIELETRLGIPASTVMPGDLPYRMRRRAEPTPTREGLRPRENEYQERIDADRQHARRQDVEQQLNLLKIYRANLAHYRAQAKAYGGVEQAMPITRHGIGMAKAGISAAKAALHALGVEIEDLPGDE